MQLPEDPFQFIAPQNPDFRTEGWQYSFGCYRWFYVVGARALLAKAKIPDLSIAISRASKVAVPPSWAGAEVWGDQYDHPLLNWSELAEHQVRQAIGTKAQRFDKASLSVLALVDAVERYGNADFVERNKTVSATHWLKIRPATFEIRDYRLNNGGGNHTPGILAAAYQTSQKFLTEVAKGHGATFRTLGAMAEYLDQNKLLQSCNVTAKNGRTPRAKTPAESEVITHSFNPNTGEIL